MKNIAIIIFLIFGFHSINAQIEKTSKTVSLSKDPVKDLPEEITYRYNVPIIPDEQTALLYADMILKRRYKGMDFDKVKPYSINLIEDEKVWEVKIPTDPQLRGIALSYKDKQKYRRNFKFLGR